MISPKMVAAHTHGHSSASADWIISLDKRPAERSVEDVDIILSRLKMAKAFERFHPSLLQQVCLCGFYECLERGITLYRQGDIGTSWYAVLSGSLDVKVSETANHQDAVTICTLGIGTAFGESILDNTPRHATIVTRELSELLRIDQKEFKSLWEKNISVLLPAALRNCSLPAHTDLPPCRKELVGGDRRCPLSILSWWSHYTGFLTEKAGFL
ncbi:hypothetical protein DPEC_G00046290 [Dallia pectoralis]|uniref:Uncharacterized protein n=1 Tax=Dallia pectoralis TaxID=75939 RepID=A0ACC2H9Z5_DALPE|nr:hypothetical protein DPEC_G00046290 [Dallia pectoralis]